MSSASTTNAPLESLTIDCPQDKVASVIGARGTVINDIMRRTGCRVVINQDVEEGEPAVVEMNGPQPQLDEAKMLVNKVIEDGPQSISLSPLLGLSAGPFANQIITDVMEIPKYKVGVAIGTKGVIIQEIMKRTNCKIVIDQEVPDGNPCFVHFSGLPNQVQSAKSIVSSVIKSGPAALNSPTVSTALGLEHGGPNSMQEIRIDQAHVGRILGTKGSIVKELQNRFMVKIKIEKAEDDKKNPDQHNVKIFGQMHNVQQACQTIYHLIEFGVEAALGAKVKVENTVRNRASTYPTPIYAMAHQVPNNIPHVGGMYYGEYSPIDPFPSNPKGVGMPSHATVPLGLGADGTSGALFPMATMPNGLQSQSAIIKNECIDKVVGKNASTLNSIKSKSGAHVQSVQTASESNCEISMIGTPMEVELASQMVQEVLTSGKGKVEAMPDVPSTTMSMVQTQMMPPVAPPQYLQSYPAYGQQPTMVPYGTMHPSMSLYGSNMPPSYVPSRR